MNVDDADVIGVFIVRFETQDQAVLDCAAVLNLGEEDVAVVYVELVHPFDNETIRHLALDPVKCQFEDVSSELALVLVGENVEF